MPRVIVDIEGADDSPGVPLNGGIQALKADASLDTVFVVQEQNRRAVVHRLAEESARLRTRVEIVAAAKVVPSKGLLFKDAVQVARDEDTTMHTALAHAKDENVAAYTCGNTAALILQTIAITERLARRTKPALVVRLPSFAGHEVVVVDVGGNPDTDAQQMVTNAEWGALCARSLYGVENPSVYMLNMGEEEDKGSRILRDATPLLRKKAQVNFCGNAEPKDMLEGMKVDEELGSGKKIDVVVADGMSGNVALKMLAAAAEFQKKLVLRKIKQGSVFSPKRGLREIAGLCLLLSFRSVKHWFKARLGTSKVLGIDGHVFQSHGSSDESQVAYGILAAHHLSQTSLLEEFRRHHGVSSNGDA